MLCPLLCKYGDKMIKKKKKKYCFVFSGFQPRTSFIQSSSLPGLRMDREGVLSQLISHIPPFLLTGLDVQCDRPNTKDPASFDCVDLCSSGEKPEKDWRLVSVSLPGHCVKP